MAHTDRPVVPARSLFHSLFVKARPESEFAQFNQVDPESGLVEIPTIVWQEFALLVDSSPLIKRI